LNFREEEETLHVQPHIPFGASDARISYAPLSYYFINRQVSGSTVAFMQLMAPKNVRRFGGVGDAVASQHVSRDLHDGETVIPEALHFLQPAHAFSRNF